MLFFPLNSSCGMTLGNLCRIEKLRRWFNPESIMSDDRKPEHAPDETSPSEATPHNPGLAPKPDAASTDSEPAPGAPYDKKADPAQQPT